MVDWIALALVATAGVLGHLLVRRVERRLPLRVARGWRPAIGIGALSAKVLLWVAVALFASDRWPALMAARDEFVRLVSSSFMAPLVRMGERAYSALDLLALPLSLAALWIGASLAMRIVRAQLARAGGSEWEGGDLVASLVHYAIVAVGATVILQAQGFDLSSLALFGGVLGVGLGFGLQNITSNFVSGVLLSFERPIKPGDFVSLGALSGTVLRIGARSTEIRTRDHVSILVPNARFLEGEVVNWTHGSPVSRVHVPVGVAYGSDVARVRAALLEAARTHPAVLRDPRPSVEFRGFGESALNFELLVWTRDPAAQPTTISDLNFSIDAGFRRRGIEVPVPQRDLRLRHPTLERVAAAWAAREFPALGALAPPADEHVSDLLPEPEHDAKLAPALWSRDEIHALGERLHGPDGVGIADRRHRFQLHRDCFVGSEAVGWIAQREGLSRAEAVAIGQRLVDEDVIHHVLDEHGFADAFLFYRFRSDEA